MTEGRPTDALHSPPPGHAEQPIGWWQNRLLILIVAVLFAAPVLITDVVPLVDLPGHMGRYRVQLDLDQSPALQQFFHFEWMLIGNLGVDLLVEPLSRILGLEFAVKLIVATIPPLTVLGFLLVAREVHGRLPPTAWFALPFAYGFPFMFGFVNFALSMALAFLAFGLWLHLARLQRFRLRTALFVPISVLVWLCHAFGWGTLGLMAFSAEWVRQLDRGRNLVPAGFRAGLHSLALSLPFVLMLLWRSGQVAGQTGDWFNWRAKWLWIKWVLRDRWEYWDLAALIVIVLLLVRAFRSDRIEFSRNLAASAISLTFVFLLLPRVIFGSAYADMRLVPFAFAVAVLAIRLKSSAGPQFARGAAAVALGFALLRLAVNGASFWLYDSEYDRQLAALEHVPRGAALVSFVGRHSCRGDWAMTRLEHLPAMGTVRRVAFTNDQWTMAGAQLLSTDYPPGGRFVRDPSQIVTPYRCRGEHWLPLDEALRRLPRDGFDYVWLIDPPRHDRALLAGLKPVWRNGASVLYQVQRDEKRTSE